jgi:hypothetical protein
VPDLLADLAAMFHNANRKAGTRALMARDFLDDPMLPRRLTASEETGRTMAIMAEFKRERDRRKAAAS